MSSICSYSVPLVCDVTKLFIKGKDLGMNTEYLCSTLYFIQATDVVQNGNYGGVQCVWTRDHS